MADTNCANHNEHMRRLENMEHKTADLERRLNKMESRQDVSDEKFKQVFDKLDEIIEILRVNQSRIPNLVWGVLGSVCGGVVVWAVLELLKRSASVPASF